MAKAKDPRIGQKFYVSSRPPMRPDPDWKPTLSGPFVMKGVWKAYGTEFCKLDHTLNRRERFLQIETKHLKPAAEVELLEAIRPEGGL